MKALTQLLNIKEFELDEQSRLLQEKMQRVIDKEQLLEELTAYQQELSQAVDGENAATLQNRGRMHQHLVYRISEESKALEQSRLDYDAQQKATQQAYIDKKGTELVLEKRRQIYEQKQARKEQALLDDLALQGLRRRNIKPL